MPARIAQTVADLAVAQRDFPDDQLTLWLNGLASRAHLRLYRAPAPSWRRLGQFFWTDFARRFRAARPYLLVSALLLFGPALAAYLAALLDPTLREALVPARLRQVMESGTTWTDMQPAMRPGMATLIFTNNIQVAFLAFAGGVLCGLGTVFVLVSNGLSLGAVLGAAQFYGVAPLLWSFISPHGYLELTCIVIAGAAGLMLGNALLRPGLAAAPRGFGARGPTGGRAGGGDGAGAHRGRAHRGLRLAWRAARCHQAGNRAAGRRGCMRCC